MRQFSALDYHYLLKELQILKNARMDKIYSPSKKELLLQVYVSGKGKKLLKIDAGKIFYLTESKKQYGEPSSFCLFLRKHIRNARIKEIKQIGFERIVEIAIETKENRYCLILEMFDKGNIILTDNKNIIINCAEQQKWKDRQIKKGELYRYPKKKYNFLELKQKDLKELLKKPQELVKVLATELGLGGLYAEEACMLAGIDKTIKANKLAEKDIKAIYKILTKLKNKKIDVQTINKDKDITPFPLKQYEDQDSKKAESFSSALDSHFSKQAVSPAEKAKQKAIEKQLKIIENQKKHIKQLEKEIKQNQRKSELIYENYQLIKDILTEINKAKKKFTWQEIKDRLKGHKTVKEVNAKDKKVIIEI